jgi:hypothetical protein
MISGFRRDVDEICALLGYYAASCGNTDVSVQRVGPIFTGQESTRTDLFVKLDFMLHRLRFCWSDTIIVIINLIYMKKLLATDWSALNLSVITSQFCTVAMF